MRPIRCCPAPAFVPALVVLAVAGCAAAPALPVAAPSTSGASIPPTVVEQACPGSDCAQEGRFASVQRYVERVVRQPHGYLGIVFTDRRTGRSWRSGATGHPGWTASTSKLAMAADLLAEHRAGRVALTDADRRDLDSMLNSSDEPASDRLWHRFGGADQLARFRDRLGMAGVHFVPGYSRGPYWGFLKCTTDDLAALAGYVLDRADPADRDHLVTALRGVAPNQRWGVWSAGTDQRPGNKNGWSEEDDRYGRHWVVNTVGFAGPDERYLLAVTYQVAPGGTLTDGVHTVSDVVALLFGAPVPAPVTVPAPDG